MSRLGIILILLSLTLPRVVWAQCDAEVARAETLRDRTVGQADWSKETLGKMIEAARLAAECFEDVDRLEAARWFSYDVWAHTALRNSVDGLKRVAEFKRRLIGVDISTDAVILTYEGGFLTRLSRLDEALAVYKLALEKAKEADNPYRVVFVHLNLVEISRRLNRPHDAFFHLDRADSVLEVSDFPEWEHMRSRVSAMRADNLLYFPNVRRSLPDSAFAEVRNRLGDALQWATRTGFSDFRHELAMTDFTLAQQLGPTSAIIDDALTYFEAHVVGSGTRWEMTWRYTLATMLRDLGEIERSIELLRQAFVFAEELHELEYGARVAGVLGRYLETVADYEEAARWYRRADETFDRHIREGGSSEVISAAFSRTTEPLRDLALMQLRLGAVEEAFQTIERARSQFLGRLRQHASFTSQTALPRNDSLVAALREVRSRLVQVKSASERTRLEADEARLMVEIKRAFPDIARDEALDVVALQRKLADQNQVLLSYLVAPEAVTMGRPAQAYVFVVTPDTIVAIALDTDSASLSDRIQTALSLSGAQYGQRTDGMDLEALYSLQEVLVAPARQFIGEGKRLVISPDGPLFYLPFGALVLEHQGRFNYSDARYLVHEHAVSIELSAALLLDPGGRPESHESVVAFARSEFEGIDAAGQSLGNLGSVRRETSAIRREVGRVRVADGPLATTRAFFEALSRADVVHVATHSTVDPSSMLNHQIVLHSDSTRTNGIVYAFDLLRQRFDTPLVVLSACATAAGPIIGGEGPAGFQYSFRASGVGSVLATQWLVDDAAMVNIAAEFYRNLAGGVSKDEALRQAQLKAIDGGRFAHPMFWSAPVLYGDASPLSLVPNRTRTTLFTGSFIVFFLTSIVLWLRLRKRKAHILYT